MGEMFSPPRTIRSVRRSATISLPSASSRPRSPVRSQPSSVHAAAVATGSPRYPLNSAGPATWISPMPSASGSPMRSATPGSGRPAVSGMDRRLVGRRRGHARAGLGQAVGRHDRPARRRWRAGRGPARDRATTERYGPQRRRRADVAAEIEQAGQSTSVTSETWLGCGAAPNAARIAAGSGRASTTSGTPDRAGAPDDAQPGDMRQADREEPAGRLGKRRQPRLGAGHQRGRREDDRLRPAGRPRGQDDDRGCGGIRHGDHERRECLDRVRSRATRLPSRRAIASAPRARAPPPRVPGRGSPGPAR